MASTPILTLPLTTLRGISTIEQSRVEARYGGRNVKYLAEITGTDPKFGLARRFLRRVATKAHEGNYYSISGIDSGKIVEFGFEDKGKRYGIVKAVTSSTITLEEASSHDVATIASTMDTPGVPDVVDGSEFSDRSAFDPEETPASTSEIVANVFEDDEPEEPGKNIAQAQDIEAFRERFKRRHS